MSVRLDLLDDVLTVALENYKDNVRILAGLDDKAQKMGAIAGLFLGALFAVIKPDAVSTLKTTIGSGGLGLLVIVILLLISCIAICLMSMWVGKVPPPVSLAHVAKMTGDLLRLPDAELNEELQESYDRAKLGIWKKCLDAQDRVAHRKARLVFAAQTTLVIGMLAFAVMLLGLLSVGHTSVPSQKRPILLNYAPSAIR